jgi:hypothetical protein
MRLTQFNQTSQNSPVCFEVVMELFMLMEMGGTVSCQIQGGTVKSEGAIVEKIAR